jgi:hypothetical protein
LSAAVMPLRPCRLRWRATAAQSGPEAADATNKKRRRRRRLLALEWSWCCCGGVVMTALALGLTLCPPRTSGALAPPFNNAAAPAVAVGLNVPIAGVGLIADAGGVPSGLVSALEFLALSPR